MEEVFSNILLAVSKKDMTAEKTNDYRETKVFTKLSTPWGILLFKVKTFEVHK